MMTTILKTTRARLLSDRKRQVEKDEARRWVRGAGASRGTSQRLDDSLKVGPRSAMI